MFLDLNADVGESFGAWTLGDDDGLLRVVTSVNVACGGHAGDASTIRRTIRAAGRAGVAIGAHPSFPDLQGFGRRRMALSPTEVEDLVLFQVAAVAGVARAEGLTLAHVKPHGALYNDAATDPSLADAIARAVRQAGDDLALVGPPGSALLASAVRAGLRTIAEAFADRGYRADGSLVPRGLPGAVITDGSIVAARACRLALHGLVDTVDGPTIQLAAQTLCIHGDTPGAVGLARLVRSELEAAGVTLAAVRRA